MWTGTREADCRHLDGWTCCKANIDCSVDDLSTPGGPPWCPLHGEDYAELGALLQKALREVGDGRMAQELTFTGNDMHWHLYTGEVRFGSRHESRTKQLRDFLERSEPTA